MVSLWGSNKNGEEHPDTEEDDQPRAASSHGSQQGRRSEANERTRLLPPPTSEGYLSPDDPAVSSSCAKGKSL